MPEYRDSCCLGGMRSLFSAEANSQHYSQAFLSSGPLPCGHCPIALPTFNPRTISLLREFF